MSEITTNEIIEDSMEEYVTFNITSKDGEEIEMAVIDEFEFERKNYVVSAVVKGDIVDEENLFIYRLKLKGQEDFEVEKITAPGEYEKVAEAYLAMED